MEAHIQSFPALNTCFTSYIIEIIYNINVCSLITNLEAHKSMTDKLLYKIKSNTMDRQENSYRKCKGKLGICHKLIKGIMSK